MSINIGVSCDTRLGVSVNIGFGCDTVTWLRVSTLVLVVTQHCSSDCPQDPDCGLNTLALTRMSQLTLCVNISVSRLVDVTSRLDENVDDVQLFRLHRKVQWGDSPHLSCHERGVSSRPCVHQ